MQSDRAERYGSHCLGVATGRPLGEMEWGDGGSTPVHKKGRASLSGEWERCHMYAYLWHTWISQNRQHYLNVSTTLSPTCAQGMHVIIKYLCEDANGSSEVCDCDIRALNLNKTDP